MTALDILIDIIILGFIPLIVLLIIIFTVIRKKKRSRKENIRVFRQHRVPSFKSVESSRSVFDLDTIIFELGAENSEYLSRHTNGFNFNVPDYHMFPFLSEIRVTKITQHSARISARLKEPFPSNLDIKRRRGSVISNQSNISIPLLSNVYDISSDLPKFWELIILRENIQNHLLSLRTHLEYLFLRGDYIEAIVYYETAVIRVLSLVAEINLILTGTTGIEKDEVEALMCYNCEDPFDPLEEVCDKCGAPRPRCIVCFLDLKPSEKEEVVQHPCCKIYSHKKHIITWLRQNSQCPNCHQNLTHWLNRLR